ncbi:hypothetical protein G7B40_009005 [Aetokthonos hydrillicola Thurmond2011]|uniref:Nucleotide-diphospho-sugar transferase domain-containing protein n=1 Tax=Aetokthonos hydrillicola Thurmond2011 TaxID=2712845 RepID=A0AAP5I4P9_9CYAN|nr:hypothetical protein [Aetokthonos hydrillicola]MDR9894706.1 hypothetical protein [Aetokthonos hydrillicola Thurmond2011]
MLTSASLPWEIFLNEQIGENLMSIPIMMIHRGYASYLIQTLNQAKYTNQESDIILLGDASNNFLNFIHHEKFDKYYVEAKKFEQVYVDKHMSPNSYSYELLCFQRWFIIKEFMQKNKIEQAVHLDSDIMTYTNFYNEYKKFEKFEYVFPTYSCLIKYDGIERICNHLMDFYTKPSLFEILKSIQEQKSLQLQQKNSCKQKIAGISDMTLLTLFRERNSDNVCTLPLDKIGLTLTKSSSEFDIPDSIYDTNINVSNGFEMHNGIKKIYWQDQQPFCRHLELDRKIKFNSLHFQGVSKKYINKYSTGSKSQVLFFNLKRMFNQGKNKLANF